MRFRNIKNRQKKEPKVEQPKYVYAHYAHRVKAFITDLFMVYTPILYIVGYLVMGGKDNFLLSQLAPFAVVALYGLIYATLLSRFGQTPGKKAYDLKVVDDRSGQNIGFFRALLRFFMFLVTASTLLGLLLPFYRRDRKALHDLVCKTIVVAIKR